MKKIELPDRDLPVIDLSDHDFLSLIRETWKVVGKINDPPYIFHYANTLVRLVAGKDHHIQIDVLDKRKLRHELVRCASYVKTLRNGEIRSVLPPNYLLEDMLADPHPPLPSLLRVITTPIFTSTGSQLWQSGHDPETGIYLALDSSSELPDVPKVPSTGEVNQAKHWVDEMLGDFPFIGPAEYAHAVALFLGPFVRNLIDGQVPITVIEASTPGTGKTLLAQAVTLAATGKPVEAMGEGRSDEEMRKRLTAKLLPSPTYVCLDNVRKKVAYSSLASVVTAGSWEDRLLGASRIVRVPVNCIWIITGNNPTFSAEMARRSVRIRLDTGHERPWLREPSQFRHPDLIKWIKNHRSQLIWSALVLIRNWMVQDHPTSQNATALGMFESWCQVIGGILAANNIPGFLENVDSLYSASDMETATWRHFTQCWWEAYQTMPVAVGTLHHLLLDHDIPIDIGPGNIRSQRIKLGLQIGNMRHQIFGDFQIIPDKRKNNANSWQLQRVC